MYDGKLSYTAQDDRQLLEMAVNGQGILGPGHLLCSAGSGMNTSIAAGDCAVRNTFAFQGGLWLARNDAPVLALHSTADPSNPRIDMVGVRVFDSETGGDNSDMTQPVVVTGTPTAGATLTNRNGVGAIPNNFLLLADVLVPAGAASAASFTYGDRRAVTADGVTTQGNGLAPHTDAVWLIPGPYSVSQATLTIASNIGSGTFVCPTYIPRKITANFFRWSYSTVATAPSSNYLIAIYDASGRGLCTTAATAFSGSTGRTVRSEALSAMTGGTVNLDAGLYYILYTSAAMNGSGTNFTFHEAFVAPGSTVAISAPMPNTIFASTGAGIASPAPTTLASLTDTFSTPITGNVWFAPVGALTSI